MALLELLWAEKITKHSNRIIAATAIKKELGEYITIKVYIYKRSLQTIPYRLYSRKNSMGLLPMILKEYTLN